MSETTIPITESTTEKGTVARRGLAGVLVALLVGGSVVLADNPNAPYDGAGDLVGEYYAERDAGEFIAAWDDRFVDQFGDQVERLEADVQGLLESGGRVVDEQVVGVAGVPLVVVTTSDQIRWCVRPDGTILPTCVLGTMTAEVDASGLAGVNAEVLGGGLDLNGAEVTFDLVSTSPDSLTLPGPAEVVGDAGGWSVVAVTQLAGGDFFPPAEDGSYTIGGPFSIRVTLAANLRGSGQIAPASFRLAFPDGSAVDVRVPGPSYWFA